MVYLHVLEWQLQRSSQLRNFGLEDMWPLSHWWHVGTASWRKRYLWCWWNWDKWPHWLGTRPDVYNEVHNLLRTRDDLARAVVRIVTRCHMGKSWLASQGRVMVSKATQWAWHWYSTPTFSFLLLCIHDCRPYEILLQIFCRKSDLVVWYIKSFSYDMNKILKIWPSIDYLLYVWNYARWCQKKPEILRNSPLPSKNLQFIYYIRFTPEKLLATTKRASSIF